MDDEIKQRLDAIDVRLQEIEGLAGTAAIEAGSSDGVSTLELRNELDDLRGRLAETFDSVLEQLGAIAEAVSGVRGDVERLNDRVASVEGTVDAIYGEVG